MTLLETTSEVASTTQVLQAAVSSFQTLSAILGLSAYIEPSRPREKSSPASSTSPLIKTYTLDDVSEHCWNDDCWIVLFDRVYDVTNFLRIHPAGVDIMLESAGRDATTAFRGVGHSQEAVNMLKQYEVGRLVEEECMWSGK